MWLNSMELFTENENEKIKTIHKFCVDLITFGEELNEVTTISSI